MNRRGKIRFFVVLIIAGSAAGPALSGCKNPLVDQILGETPAGGFVSSPGFTSVEALSAWLRGAVQNTRDNPYHVILGGIGLESLTNGADPQSGYFDALGRLYSALWGKYVALDLSGCWGAGIPGSRQRDRPNRDMIVSVVLPPSVIYIGNSAFYRCGNLTSVTLPPSLTGIGNDAFSGCVSLASVTLPPFLTTLGSGAFSDCENLRSVSLSASVQAQVEAGAFTGCSKLVFTVTGAGPYRASEEGKMLIRDTVLAAYPSAEGSVTIPAGVTALGDYVFYGNSKISAVTLPSGLTGIGNGAFAGCTGLSSVSLPASLTGIGYRAFEGCTGLSSVSLPASLTGIGDRAFWYCSSLTSVTLPASLTGIGDGAFGGCLSLTSVTLPPSLSSIGRGAFSDCPGLYLLTSRAITPPEITGEANLGLGTACVIKVPSSSVAAYKNAEGWKRYADRISGF